MLVQAIHVTINFSDKKPDHEFEFVSGKNTVILNHVYFMKL